jgi:hypothetical protein
MPLAVLGLLAATLLLAAINHRYQRYQAEVRAAVRRFEARLLQITEALAALGPVPLSRELRVLLRADVLARYQRIARLYRRYPDIRQRLAEAETALHAEGDLPGRNVGPIDSEQSFRRFTSSLDNLIDIIRHGALLQPVPRDVREIFVRELGERRAEVMARFHLVEARRLEQQGDLTKARAHLTTLMQRLRRLGPSTPFVQALYDEAEQALVALGRRAFETQPQPADGAEEAAAARPAASEVKKVVGSGF